MKHDLIRCGDKYLMLIWTSCVSVLGFRELLFSSPAVEVAVLRELSDALVRNLFPKSFWGQEINHCALNEIIALKGKKGLNHLSTVTLGYIRTKLLCFFQKCEFCVILYCQWHCRA